MIEIIAVFRDGGVIGVKGDRASVPKMIFISSTDAPAITGGTSISIAE
jgi:hypothetical protein